MIEDFDKFRRNIKLIEDGGLNALNSFALRVEFPRSHDLGIQGELQRVLAAKLFRNIAEVLESAELYDTNNLNVGWSEGNLVANYGEPSFGFTVEITKNLDIVIHRSGSSFPVFHIWYKTIMPFAQGLISRAALDLTEILASDYDLIPLRALYTFSIIAFDFKPTHGSGGVTSHEILEPLLARLPAEDGRLSSLGGASSIKSAKSDLARVDVKTSRVRYVADDTAIREVYSVEAPANQGYRGIWFAFTCIAESLDTNEAPGLFQPRLAPKVDFLLENYEIPYVDFFRDRAVAGFMTDLFEHYSFSCTTGTMP